MNRSEDEEKKRAKFNAKRNIRRRQTTVKNKIARIDNAKLTEQNNVLNNENEKLKKQLERANRLARRNARKGSSLAPHSAQGSQVSSVGTSMRSSVAASRDVSIGAENNNGNDKSEISDPSVQMEDKDAQIAELKETITTKDAQIAQLNESLATKDAQIKEAMARIAELEEALAKKDESKEKDDESMPMLSFQNEEIEINEISIVPKRQMSSKKLLLILETIYEKAKELRKSTNDAISKIVPLQQEEEIKKCIDDTLTKDIVYEGEKKRLIAKSKLMDNYKLQALEAMKIYSKVSDEEWDQQMTNIDQRRKPEFAQNVYLNGVQVGALHQKIIS